MKFLTRLMAVLAILASIVWAGAFLSTVRVTPPIGSPFWVTRGCYCFDYVEMPEQQLAKRRRASGKKLMESFNYHFYELWPADGAVFRVPRYEEMSFGKDGLGRAYRILVPHWLTNLIAWSLFFILWRKSRKHPKGHCQGCGYDLRMNESGRCPECNAEVAS